MEVGTGESVSGVRMRILAVSDMHGEIGRVRSLVLDMEPDLLLCCGDWGDPGQIARDEYQWILDRTHALSIFGNHDDLDLLSPLTNRDGSPALLSNGEVRQVGPITVAGISGIWAKTHRLPWYITDEEVLAASERAGRADVLMTHGCAVGLVDGLPGGRRGGQRCFLEAFKLVRPRVYLCGHLHFQQTKQLKDGTIALNVGDSARGDYAMIEFADGSWDARAETLGGRPTGA